MKTTITYNSKTSTFFQELHLSNNSVKNFVKKNIVLLIVLNVYCIINVSAQGKQSKITKAYIDAIQLIDYSSVMIFNNQIITSRQLNKWLKNNPQSIVNGKMVIDYNTKFIYGAIRKTVSKVTFVKPGRNYDNFVAYWQRKKQEQLDAQQIKKQQDELAAGLLLFGAFGLGNLVWEGLKKSYNELGTGSNNQGNIGTSHSNVNPTISNSSVNSDELANKKVPKISKFESIGEATVNWTKTIKYFVEYEDGTIGYLYKYYEKDGGKWAIYDGLSSTWEYSTQEEALKALYEYKN